MNYKKFPIVSILLPVFNGGDTLLSAVHSIVNQDYSDWELLILDDGSTDHGVGSLNTLNDARIRIISDGQRKGLAARLNEGIDLASGYYLARMDADDIAFPSRLTNQVDFMEQHPEIDLLGTRALAFSLENNNGAFGMLPFKHTHEELTEYPWRGIYLPHPTWLGRAKWFRRNKYLNPEVLRAEDQELLLRAMPESKYHCLPDVLLAYRIAGFNFRRSLLSRKEFFKAQTNIFLSRSEWLNLSMSFLYFGIGLVFDAFRKIIPAIFFLKFKEQSDLSLEVQSQFNKLLNSSKAIK